MKYSNELANTVTQLLENHRLRGAIVDITIKGNAIESTVSSTENEDICFVYGISPRDNVCYCYQYDELGRQGNENILSTLVG